MTTSEPDGSGGGANSGTARALWPRQDPRGRASDREPHRPWHFLNFLPEPHQQGSLRPGSFFGAVCGCPLPLIRAIVLVPLPVFVCACACSACSACSAVRTVTRRIVCATPLAMRADISS